MHHQNSHSAPAQAPAAPLGPSQRAGARRAFTAQAPRAAATALATLIKFVSEARPGVPKLREVLCVDGP
jgi:hypothetical protein